MWHPQYNDCYHDLHNYYEHNSHHIYEQYWYTYNYSEASEPNFRIFASNTYDSSRYYCGESRVLPV